MNKQSILALMLICILTFSGVFINVNTSFANEKTPKATWLWHTKTITEEETIQFIINKDVTTVYLQINEDVKRERYAAFIKRMNDAGIEVLALDGSSKWKKKDFDDLLKWLQKYHSTYPNQKFAGVHLDVEPYTSSLWDTNQAQAIFEYQDLMNYVDIQLKNTGLRFELDMPFWFDNRFYDNSFGKGNIAEWIISKADSVTIMAYRDTVDSIVRNSETEIAYGKKYNTKVVLGVETKKSSEGNKVSFAEEGESYMNETLNKVRDHFKNEEMFGGFAIHHVQNWQTMKK